jgi:hypothetical protein
MKQAALVTGATAFALVVEALVVTTVEEVQRMQ